MIRILGVWAIELGLFALLVAALLAERPLPLALATAAIAALCVAARAAPRG